ncbi:hypothetical protein V8B97DRAFT_1916936 [Scleroderma yunnanense]
MWKQFGTKVVIVVAWKDTKGKLMAGMDDFNDELEDGTAFPEWESIQDKWSSYATDVFDTKEIVDGEEINKGVGGNRRVQKGKKRPPVAPPTLEDGTPQIPNILDMHASEKDIISKVKKRYGLSKIFVCLQAYNFTMYAMNNQKIHIDANKKIPTLEASEIGLIKALLFN